MTLKNSQNQYQKESLELDFEMKRLGNKILELKNISKSFGIWFVEKTFLILSKEAKK